MTHGGAARPDDWVVLSEALPQLAQRLQAELTAIGLPALAEQIDGLVVQPCGCGEDYCASLRTSHPATRRDPARDQSALLDNLVVVDAPDGDITYIEILEAEVRQQLQRLFPSWPWDRKAKQPRRGKERYNLAVSKNDRKKKKPKTLPAAPATPPIGSAQQEAPPPIEGPLNAMVIMAHPDDAEFVCGGTVAKWCAEGWDVRYVLVTGGDKGTHDESMHPEKLAAIREEEQRAACRRLGVKECILLGYPDGFTVDEHELRGQIVRLLRIHRPDVVITWDAFRRGFNHRDHRNVGTVTADAIYPLVRDRLFYPQHEEDGLVSHQVNEVLLAGSDDPDYSVDITAHWETKVEAILCHTSQIGGRTREDFLKQRREQVEREGEKPIEERFRRWSIRRPMRHPGPEGGAAAAAAPPAVATLVAKPKGQH